jgi:hypothetical protein
MTSHDSDFERQLRRALRPADPPDGFADRVMAAIRHRDSPRSADTLAPSSDASPRHARRWQAAWLPTAASVALVVAAGAGWSWHRQLQVHRAQAAREQVYRALRISSETLNAALAVAIDPTQPG